MTLIPYAYNTHGLASKSCLVIPESKYFVSVYIIHQNDTGITSASGLAQSQFHEKACSVCATITNMVGISGLIGSVPNNQNMIEWRLAGYALL